MRSDSTEDFLKRIATASDFFIELISTQYGLWGTTNPTRLIIKYFDPDNVCSSATFIYPARDLCGINSACNDIVCDESYMPSNDDYLIFYKRPPGSFYSIVYLDGRVSSGSVDISYSVSLDQHDLETDTSRFAGVLSLNY